MSEDMYNNLKRDLFGTVLYIPYICSRLTLSAVILVTVSNSILGTCCIVNTFLCQVLPVGAVELALQFRALLALAENPGAIPSSHMMTHSHP